MAEQAEEWTKSDMLAPGYHATYVWEGVELICHAANEEAADQIIADHTAARVGRDLVKYTNHDYECSLLHSMNKDTVCTCGLQSALDAMSRSATGGGEVDG